MNGKKAWRFRSRESKMVTQLLRVNSLDTEPDSSNLNHKTREESLKWKKP